MVPELLLRILKCQANPPDDNAIEEAVKIKEVGCSDRSCC